MSLNWHLRSKKPPETLLGGIWPSPRKFSFVSVPAHSWGRISMHLTYEVNRLFSQYNLIHWPTDEHWFFCSNKHKHTISIQFNSIFILLFQMHIVLACTIFCFAYNHTGSFLIPNTKNDSENWIYHTPPVRLDHCLSRPPYWSPRTRTCLRHSFGCVISPVYHHASEHTKNMSHVIIQSTKKVELISLSV